MHPYTPHPYAPRPITFRGVREHDGWRLKLYTINYDAAEVDPAEFAGGLALAEAALPAPARRADRPGLGVIVAHRGATALYLVLGWWDRENELPTRVFIRETGAGAAPAAAWRPARDGESFCVWDLQVLWHEREAYVATMLDPDGADEAAYLARTLHVEVPLQDARD
jgi:hypothetical protein